MGRIVAICTSVKKGTKKEEVKEIELVEDFGLKGDAHGGKWHRQVSLLAKEEIDSFNKKGGKVVYGDFGENLVTEGIDLASLSVGDKVIIGDALIEITQLGKKCHDKCEIFYSVGECIMPTKGIFGKVLKGGDISLGEKIELY
ncbi:MOSC domain-containing protein [Clostridium intestinale]|jgi:MOSC domain-containing protein YiiM|uniref:MOSC domain-containing protein n=1 Tax=Clostridium intestinale DSM 6191 TaxID=1121320 RepID=A0A1M5YGW2_9CLOT|nr:MOSC domain-containing protein [Clostridium intestinale]SHI11149.1 MOSC domain-containing protein [Clostridium intestinale DSM 6191]